MSTVEDENRSGLGIAELVALTAALMSLNALAIDIMLPALPHVGSDLGVSDPNHRQYIVIAYVWGLGAAQLFFGPLSDRYGRRGPLLVSLVGYAFFGGVCIVSESFAVLVAARTLQGVAAAGARVISLSVIRDLHTGRTMARIMSLVVMVFMAVPMLAPNIGQLVLMVATWRWIFVVLVAFGLFVAGWVSLRLEETLPRERRRPLSVRALWSSYALVFKTRVTFGYMIGSGVLFGGLFSFISSSEQIYSDVYDKQTTFTLYFASVAAVMAVSAFLNSRLVERWGMRPLAHAAVAGYATVSIVLTILLVSGYDTLIVFHGSMMLIFFFFSFIGPNFNAIAMEPLGEIAGTASAALGFASTMLAGTLGAVVGQQFDGTAVPMAMGMSVLGVTAMAIVAFAESGKLFVSKGAS